MEIPTTKVGDDGVVLEEALKEAIEQNLLQSVLVILSKDPKQISARNKEDGKTALHLACEQGGLNIVKLLLRLDADPQVRSTDGKLPVELATAKVADFIKDFTEFRVNVEKTTQELRSTYSFPQSNYLRRLRVWDEFIVAVGKKLASTSTSLFFEFEARSLLASLLDDLFLGVCREAIRLTRRCNLEAGMVTPKEIEYGMRLLVGSIAGHGGELMKWAIADGNLACSAIKSSGFGSSSRVTSWSWETGRDAKRLLPFGDVLRWLVDLVRPPCSGSNKTVIGGSVDPMSAVFISAALELITTELLKASIQPFQSAAKSILAVSSSLVHTAVFEDFELNRLFCSRYGKSRFRQHPPSVQATPTSSFPSFESTTEIQEIIQQVSASTAEQQKQAASSSKNPTKYIRITSWTPETLTQLQRIQGQFCLNSDGTINRALLGEVIRISRILAEYRCAKLEIVVETEDVLEAEYLLFSVSSMTTSTNQEKQEVESGGFDFVALSHLEFRVPSYVESFGSLSEYSASRKDLETLDILLVSSAPPNSQAAKLASGQRAAAVARILAATKEKNTTVDAILDSGGRTIVMFAAQKGDVETTNFFLRKGSKVNYYVSRRLAPFGSSARSALAFAVASGKVEVVHNLLSIQGVDVDPSDTRLFSPTSSAIESKKKEADKAGDDEDDEREEDEDEDEDDDEEGEDEGASPLDLSVRLLSPTGRSIIARLLAAGADITSRFEERLGLIELASSNGCLEVVKLLLGFIVGTSAGGIFHTKSPGGGDDEYNNIAADLIEENKNSCYLAGVTGFVTRLVPELLQVGFTLSEHAWQVCLAKAAAEGDVEAVEYLYLFNKAKEEQKKRNWARSQQSSSSSSSRLSAGSSKQKQTQPLPKPQELTPFHISQAAFNAAEGGHLEVLVLLLDFYKDVARKAFALPQGVRELTPLMVAALNGHIRVVDWLKQLTGIEIDRRTSVQVGGMTALMCALDARDFESARSLKASGANPELMDALGVSSNQRANKDGIQL